MNSFLIRFLIVAFAAVALCVPAPDKASDDMKIFKDYCAKHNKKYPNEAAEKMAMERILKAYAEIEAHNKLYDQGKVSYRKGLNHHSDLSDEEFEGLSLGYMDSGDSRSKRQGDNHEEFPPGPPSIDWREKGLVGPVLNQGQCGSCWAFSVVEVVETVWRKNNNTITPSPQQLVDCDHHAAFGCHGGNPTAGLEYVKRHGIMSASDYPYKVKEGTCHYDKSEVVGKVHNIHHKWTDGNETALKDILATVGPISISICMNHNLKHYQGDVFDDPECCTKNNHAPFLVGYGTDPKYGDYWIMKNSWGTGWGNNGYAKIARNKGNMCNIAREALWAS